MFLCLSQWLTYKYYSVISLNLSLLSFSLKLCVFFYFFCSLELFIFKQKHVFKVYMDILLNSIKINYTRFFSLKIVDKSM